MKTLKDLAILFLVVYAAFTSLVTSFFIGESFILHQKVMVYEFNPIVAPLEVLGGVLAFLYLAVKSGVLLFRIFRSDPRYLIPIFLFSIAALVYLVFFALPDNGVRLF